jgi:hypothetical protein
MNCANHPDRERVAFCQNCGKPLCQECMRTVGSAVFCEPCLAAKLAGVGTAPNMPPGGGYPYTSATDSVNYAVDGVIPPPHLPGAPSPGLATLLGFIPGVGAMYNGQYAKGVVHLIVFAILVSLANENGIFGLFVAGWIVYQAIEANHTARAKLAGTPLPNPFGLNDLGERLGFGRAWPSAAAVPPNGQPTSAAPDATASQYYAPPASGYPPYTPPSQQWAPPADNYAYQYAVPPVPPMPPFTPPLAVDETHYNRNRFPTGAIWLIGLGIIFLIGNIGIFHGFPVHRLIPFLLIGLGVWLFTRKMTDTGYSLTDDGTVMYRLRLCRALRGSVWVILVGILFLLDSFNILSWGRSWPLFIIVGGLMAFFERTACSTAVPPGYPYAPQQPAAAPAQPAATTSSIIPADRHDQEGN